MKEVANGEVKQIVESTQVLWKEPYFKDGCSEAQLLTLFASICKTDVAKLLRLEENRNDGPFPNGPSWSSFRASHVWISGNVPLRLSLYLPDQSLSLYNFVFFNTSDPLVVHFPESDLRHSHV